MRIRFDESYTREHRKWFIAAAATTTLFEDCKVVEARRCCAS
jgi:hypothetical protein